MNKEALLAEMNRLLDLGEPLLDMFPKHPTVGWVLQLPDNTSSKMRLYAEQVAWKADDRKEYQNYRQHDTTDFLAELVKDFEAGLLGWRAIGVLK